MSHFTVMVVTDSPEEVDAALQPFHQYECTGEDDEYVIDVDRTEEILKEFKEGTTSYLLLKDGSYVCPYDDQYKVEITAEEYKAFDEVNDELRKVARETDTPVDDSKYTNLSRQGFGNSETYFKRIKPEGAKEVRIPYEKEYTEIKGKTFVDWINDHYGWNVVKPGEELTDETKYGRVEVDAEGNVVRCVDRTNPNYKWDWWTIGGRWQGMLKVKDQRAAQQGSPSLLGKMQGQETKNFDQTQIKNLDFDAMTAEYAENAKKSYAEAMEKENEKHREFLYGIKPGETEEQYVKRHSHFSTFAVLMDGKWYEKGEMGWWGIVSNEKEESDWQVQFTALLRSMHPEKWITIVDCHI